MKLWRGVLTISALAGAAAPAAAGERAFAPAPASKPVYATGAAQPMDVAVRDGERVHLEVYKPVAASGGPQPPARLPVALIMTSYRTNTEAASPDLNRQMWWVQTLTRYGYAVAVGDALGYGGSTGCMDNLGPRELDASAWVVDELGRLPWSNGDVAMVGNSYDAMQALGVATRRDPGHLRAIIPTSTSGSVYEGAGANDGIAMAGAGPAWLAAYFASSLTTGGAPKPERAGCLEPHLAPARQHDEDGSITSYWADRDFRRGAQDTDAAVLWVQGYGDPNLMSLGPVGLFDRLPGADRHKLVMGQWGHGAPDTPNWAAVWNRTDYEAMVVAWLDRWLLGLPTGVEAWPRIQTQDSLRRWRAEDDWPAAGRSVGQLALAAEALEPQGSMSYPEVSNTAGSGAAVFRTPKLDEPLHITGQPVADLWLKLERDDAHVAATLTVLDANDQPIPTPTTWGLRSAQHLEPIRDGNFTQEKAVPAPVGAPIRVPVRFTMTDLVVPAGGRLQLSIAGTFTSQDPLNSTPSGSDGTVTILGDCAHPSVLRFRLPSTSPEFLKVAHATAAPANPASIAVDGGGLAVRQVCDREPVDPQAVVSGDASSTRGAAQRRPRHRMSLRVRPKRTRAGSRTRFAIRTTDRRGRPVAGVRVRLARARTTTGRQGTATLVARLISRRRHVAVATKPGWVRARAAIGARG
jgi:predicted acyl esterase